MGSGKEGRRWALASLVLVSSAAACAPMGVGVGLPGQRHNVVDGWVRDVDPGRGWLALDGRDGRTRSLAVDRSTPVRYDRRTYPVAALEPGDEVRVWISRDRRGAAWADRVQVLRSARERYARPAPRAPRALPLRIERLDGWVLALDRRRGWMEVETRRGGGRVLVRLAARLDRRDARRLDRLRPGDRVKMEVALLRDGGTELVRFR